jgi:hypothetical protein
MSGSQKPNVPAAGSKVPAGKMERRKALGVLLGGAAAGTIIPGVAATHPIYDHVAHHAAGDSAPTVDTGASWKPDFLDAQQNEALIVLAERILPGSTSAQVNRFIDLALSVESPSAQNLFLRALAAFEGEAMSRHKITFAQLTDARQIDILTAATNTPLTQTSRIRNNDWVSNIARGAVVPQPVSLGDQLEYLKGWIVGAYYSSETGMRELGWTGNPVYEDFPGCQHPEGHK